MFYFTENSSTLWIPQHPEEIIFINSWRNSPLDFQRIIPTSDCQQVSKQLALRLLQWYTLPVLTFVMSFLPKVSKSYFVRCRSVVVMIVASEPWGPCSILIGSSIGIRQEDHPEFKVLLCSNTVQWQSQRLGCRYIALPAPSNHKCREKVDAHKDLFFVW